MPSNITHSNEHAVYPGEYIPLPEIEVFLEESMIHSKEVAKPLVNMDEFIDCFKFKVALPGVKREDISIRAYNNILSVAVLYKDCEKREQQSQLHEFEAQSFERIIILPDDADTEFANAEFKEGILSITIPKANAHIKNALQQIIVY